MNNTNYLRDTVDLVKQIETRFLELAARLYKISEEKLWQDNYDSFMEFIDATGLARPFASQLTTLHKVYVVEHRVAPAQLAKVGYSKLVDAIPLLETSDVKTVLNKANLLTKSELRQEVREERHGDCKHKETITICAGCHKRME